MIFKKFNYECYTTGKTGTAVIPRASSRLLCSYHSIGECCLLIVSIAVVTSWLKFVGIFLTVKMQTQFNNKSISMAWDLILVYYLYTIAYIIPIPSN